MVQNIIILGGGSAGFLAAISLKHLAPKLNVTVIRSREIGIIGVGEGSTLALPIYLHKTLKIDPGEFLRVAQPVWKLGIRFIQWGPREFFDYTFSPNLHAIWNDFARPVGYFVDEDFAYSSLSSALMTHDRAFARDKQGRPILNHDFGYHIENRHFVEFVERHANSLGIRIVEDTVESVAQDDRGISSLCLRSGQTVTADLYVDCSGFASVLLGKTLQEPFVSYKSTLYCERAIIGGWERTDEPIKVYTTCETMDAGWAWQIEHEHRINRGYVYAPAFISDEQAEAEFRRKNPKLGPTRIVPFISGRYERAWVKNVCAIGNACGFVEPLEATSLGVICDESSALAYSLVESQFDPAEMTRKAYNRRIAAKWDHIRRFLAIHYRFNTRLETAFWRECREKVDLCDIAEFVDVYREIGPSFFHRQTYLDLLDQFQLEGYFTLLVGQCVPYRCRYTPTPTELELWGKIRAHLKSQAMAGYTVQDALALFRRPEWQWDPKLYA